MDTLTIKICIQSLRNYKKIWKSFSYLFKSCSLGTWKSIERKLESVKIQTFPVKHTLDFDHTKSKSLNVFG